MSGSSRWWWLLVPAAVVGAIAVIATGMGIGYVIGRLVADDTLPRVVVPGAANLDLPAGRYTLYAQLSTDEGGPEPELGPVSGLDCRVTAPSGRPVEVGRTTGRTTVTVGTEVGHSMFRFRAATGGRHTLLCDYPVDGPSAVIAAHRSGPSLGTVAMWAAAGGLIAGLGSAAVLLVWRRRHSAGPSAGPSAGSDAMPAERPPWQTGPPPTPTWQAGPPPAAMAPYPAAGPVPMAWYGYQGNAPRPQGPGISVRRILAIMAAVVVAGGLLALASGALAMAEATEQGALLTSDAPNGPGSTTESDVSFDALRVGDCIDDPGGAGPTNRVPRLPCSTPHDEEVYAIVVLMDGPWPGMAMVDDQTARLCGFAAHAFIGIPAEQSELNLESYMPVEEGWNAGDRTAICVAIDPGGKSTGTLRGSRR